MVVSFNKLNQVETPQLTLCNPGSVWNDATGKITGAKGVLSGVEAEENVFNFNSTSELNFRVNLMQTGDETTDATIKSTFEMVKNRRLIFEEDIGFFEIVDVKETNTKEQRYKDVSARSVECELEHKQIPNIQNGTYKLYETDPREEKPGIVNMLLGVLPLWHAGYIDEEYWDPLPGYEPIRRTFEDLDLTKNCLNFLLSDVQDAYECIVEFDIKLRLINIYHQSNYVHRTDIILTHDDLINSVEVSENSDELYTAVSAIGGGEDVNISLINPLGTNVVYNFSYYRDWMSSDLQNRLNVWTTQITNNESNAKTNAEYCLTYRQQISTAEAEIERLTTLKEMYQRCYENAKLENNEYILTKYNAAISDLGGTVITIASQTLQEDILGYISATDTAITTAETAKNTAQSQYNQYNAARENLANTLAPQNFFSFSLYQELCNYIFEGTYNDEYVIVTDDMSVADKIDRLSTLYNRAKSTLDKAAVPSKEFTIDNENFIFSKSFQHLTEDLQTGSLIAAEIKEGTFSDLFLVAITVNYDDKTCSLKFGDEYNKLDAKSLFDNVLGGISKSSNSIGYINNTIYPIKQGKLNEMNSEIEASKKLSLKNALAADSQDVIIDASGYTGRKIVSGVQSNEQIKIVNNAIVFTDDAWQTCKTALGKITYTEGGQTYTAYGLIADRIVGDLILSASTKIESAGGIVSINPDGIKIEYQDALIELDGTGLTMSNNAARGRYVDISTLDDCWLHSLVINGAPIIPLSADQEFDYTDLNNLTEPGFYSISNIAGCMHGPEPSSDWTTSVKANIIVWDIGGTMYKDGMHAWKVYNSTDTKNRNLMQEVRTFDRTGSIPAVFKRRVSSDANGNFTYGTWYAVESPSAVGTRTALG